MIGQVHIWVLIVFACLSLSNPLLSISSLANNDPYPMYSSVYDPYMTTWTKEWLKGYRDEECAVESFAIAISPFYQKASKGRTFSHERALLGDLQGYWNMLALTYGQLPEGESLQNTQLGEAKVSIFSDLYSTVPTFNPDAFTLQSNNSTTAEYLLTDSGFRLGYISVPVKYNKVGIRFQMEAQPFNDFGFTLQGGVSEIRQTVTAYINRTDLLADSVPALDNGEPSTQPFPNNPFRNIPAIIDNAFENCNAQTPKFPECTTPYAQIQANLMPTDQIHQIFLDLGVDDCNFERTSFEDIRLIAWWRHIYEVNETREDECWAHLLIIPSVSFNVIMPAGKPRNRNELYSLPFGNDRHWSVGGDAGLALDFSDTVEIFAGGGLNYFFARDVSVYRIPNDPHQQGFFPFATAVRVKPGFNFNFGAGMHAHWFIDRLSATAEWVMVKHEEDDIELLTPDPAFFPRQAECITKFTVHVINAALNYDISPNLAIGALAQFPISQRNAYRSTTFLATFRAVF
jgi:hypothetical protein